MQRNIKCAIHSKLQKAGVVGAVNEHGRVMKASRENIATETGGNNSFVSGRRSSLLVNMDDESNQILGMLKRTNTGRRTTALNGESIMKSGSIVTGSTANDKASLTVNAGSHTARAVHGMINKSHGAEGGQDVGGGNENFEIAADTKNTSSFSKSNPIFSLGSNKETQLLNCCSKIVNGRSHVFAVLSQTVAINQSFLNANSSRQATSNPGLVELLLALHHLVCLMRECDIT